MERSDNNNPFKDDHKSDPEQEASSSGTKRLDSDSITASDLGNFDQANPQEGDRSDKEMHPCIQPKPVTNASQKGDGASNSGTLEKSNSSETYDKEKKASKDSKDGAPAKQRNLGMIDSLVGATYQQKLSIPIVCQVANLIRIDKQLNVTITNDDEEGGLFDDIVFKSNDGDLFILAKHKEDKSYTITWDDLTSTDKGAPFAISKYLNSFLEKEWDKRDDPPVLVLCTNIGLREEVKSTVAKYSFGTNVVDSILNSITNDAYKIDWNVLNEESKTKLLDYLKGDSELGTLARLIAQHIFQGTTVDFRNESVLKKYRPVIENEIAAEKTKAQKCYKVNKEFFNANKEFKRLFEHEYKLQQKEQLIWDDIKKKGIKLVKVEPTKCEDKINQKRILNSDSVDLATQLAQHIFHGAAIDFLIPLFKKYRFIIEKCIATDEKMGDGCYVVDVKVFNKPGFKDFKRLFDIEYQKLLKPEPLDIWRDVRNRGISLKKDKKPDKSGKNELPKQVEDVQIEKFFKSFMIVCNTRHEEKQVVASIRESELLPENIKDPLSLALIFNKLGMWILERMKDKSNPKKGIERRDVDELFLYIEILSQFSQWKGISNLNCNSLFDLGFQCKQDVLHQLKLYKNLHSLLATVKNNENKEFNVKIDQYNYPSWVVPQIIQSFESQGDFLYLVDTQFELRKNQIMDLFCGLKSSLILVLECKNSSNIKGYIEAKVEEMSTKTFKKVILIDQTFSASEAERDLLFSDLTDESKTQVLQQTELISFFGTETSTGEVIHDEDKLDCVLHVLKLTSGTGIKCNKLKKSYEKIKDMYIDRKWRQCDEEKLRETSSSDFWYARKEGTSLTNLFSGCEADNKISYKTFLDYNILDTKKMHNILLHRNSECTHPPGVDGTTKVHVIFNEAGSGKSFYLTWLASYLQDLRPSWWIIKVNLNEYSMEFDQLQKKGECETIDELIAIRFLLQLVYLAFHVENSLLVVSKEKPSYAQTTAEALVFSNGCLKLDENKMKTLSYKEIILLRIFKHKFNSKQIVILMDGFDEIEPDCKAVVLKLLTNINTFDGICKMYLSSRPFGLRKELATTFNDCTFYCLIEFCIEDQHAFIHQYLLKYYERYKSLNEIKQGRTNLVVYEILKTILLNMMENPLFLSIGVELLIPMVENYIDLEEETISRQIIDDCLNRFEVLSLVECFVDKKLKTVSVEKSESANTVSLETNVLLNYEQVKATYSVLALYTIFNKKDINKLLLDGQQKTAYFCMENIKKGLEKISLVRGVINNTPIFSYRLIGEYFAAFWFYSNQKIPGVKDFLKCKLYETTYAKEIKIILDRMICRKSSLHMAVLDGSKDKIDSILTENPNSVNERDEWGRTPLQLAILPYLNRGGTNIVDSLLEWVNEESLNLKDTYFDWFTLDYAYCSDMLSRYNYNCNRIFYWVHELLEIGASIDTPEMFARFSYKETSIMFSEALVIEFFATKKNTSNFESFFTKLVANFVQKNCLNLDCPVETEALQNRLVLEDCNDLNIKITEKTAGIAKIPLLKFCVMTDSALFKILIENSDPKIIDHALMRLAIEFRSINVLHYLIIDLQLNFSLIDDFQKVMVELVIQMQSNEQKFKSLFNDYCTRYKIDSLEENEIQAISVKRNENKCVLSQRDLWQVFPTEFKKISENIDNGTFFLVSKAMQNENHSVVEYLLLKTKVNLDNRYITQLIQRKSPVNTVDKWCFKSSIYFIILLLSDRSKGLERTDDKGRNLLQLAVIDGNLDLVKYLVKLGLKPTKTNTKENCWNAFFYCATNERKNDCQKKLNCKIFTYMQKEDPMNCFEQFDSKGKCVFYYAVNNSPSISKYIIETEFSTNLEDLNSNQFNSLLKKFKTAGFNAMDMLKYFADSHLDSEIHCKSICNALESIDELQYTDASNRNLLHIAIMGDWLLLGKCLVEQFEFDMKKINEKENNWNAFFYCVSERRNNYFSEERKHFFSYIMKKNRMDCFEQLDSKEKSVFYYAVKNNHLIFRYLIETEFSSTMNIFDSEQFTRSCKQFQTAGLNAIDMVTYLVETHLDEPTICQSICSTLNSINELQYTDECNRDLLHIAIRNDWFELGKCLIEHFGFDVKKINEKENNWNAFFYCVSECNNKYFCEERKVFFTYIMEKDPMDCFEQLDLEGKSVFYYAFKNIRSISQDIIESKFASKLKDFDSNQISLLLKQFKTAGFNAKDMITYLENTHLDNERACQSICNALKSIDELQYKDEFHRNLLHIAIMHDWLALGKCLVENFEFDVKKTNEKENNWNAFFYCLSGGVYKSSLENSKKFFSYIMEKDPMDCFEQLDSKEKSVFYYAVENNHLISQYIIELEFSSKLQNFDLEQITLTLERFKKAGFDGRVMLEYFEGNHLDNATSCKSICNALKSIDELQCTDECNRDLLHIAIRNDWLELGKCLVEHFEFDLKKTNKKENNWNAFFYFVSDCKYKSSQENSKIFFSYIMEKDPMDCFDQLDLEGKSVFYYAVKNKRWISEYIIESKFSTNLKNLNEEQINILFQKFKITGFNVKDMVTYLAETHLHDATKCQSICNALKSIDELQFTDELNRNLLHIAIMHDWLVLGKCLVENFHFDVKKPNEKENNWNAFFYCLSGGVYKSSLENSKKFFSYIMEKDPMDCFEQLDSKEKSVFYYAVENNHLISQYIIELEFSSKLQNFDLEQITLTLERFKKAGFDGRVMLEYFEGNHLDNATTCKSICNALKSIDELQCTDECNRNLLHIAIRNDWLELGKCLVEHFGFDLKKTNEKENNWNAFFYFVSDCRHKSSKEKSKIFFSYIMEKDPMDCFEQLDLEGKSVFYYAVKNKRWISEYIIESKFSTKLEDINTDQLTILFRYFKTTGFNAKDMVSYFADTLLNRETTCKLICNALKLINELQYTDEMNRNLLHIAILKDWLILGKCLVKHFELDVKKNNEKENDWNAFFYCVCNSENVFKKFRIFTYMMDKYPFNCLEEVDSKGKCVLHYSAKHNPKISEYIVQRKFPKQMKYMNNKEDFRNSIVLIAKSNLDTKEMMCYLQNTLLRDETSCKTFCETLNLNNKLLYTDESNRNLLHIAILNGWIVLGKCLVDYFGFDVKKINEKENNWNAFFYCVAECKNKSFSKRRKNFFYYIMKKEPMDCFEQFDSKGKHVLYYAVENNRLIAKYIIESKFSTRLKDFNVGQITLLLKQFKKAGFNAKEMVTYLADTHLNSETTCQSICNALKSIDQLQYTDEMNRNLLHIAIMNDWLVLAKWVIEHRYFNVKTPNEKENNWNAFFYCVCNRGNVSKKIEIFKYMMEKDSHDPFEILDWKEKAVAYYAFINNRMIFDYVIQQFFPEKKSFINTDEIERFIKLLKKSGFETKEMLKYFKGTSLHYATACKIICKTLEAMNELEYKDEMNRNLLHFAVMEGWFTLSKCLIEHYRFDTKKTNEKENNWNAFFYCVSNHENGWNKLEIFNYLMKKDSFNCFDELDLTRKSVFCYATRNNVEIANVIFKQKYKSIQDRSIQNCLNSLNINIIEKLRYFQQNQLVDEQSVETIFDYLSLEEVRRYRNNETGRNVLQIVIVEGWYILSKYLIEHNIFDTGEINRSENNWSSLFYCVSNNKKMAEKLKIFKYIMGNDAKKTINCFDLVDSNRKSVFYYATLNNEDIAKEIFCREKKILQHLSNEARITKLMDSLYNSPLNALGKLTYFKPNHLIDDVSVKTICNILKAKDELSYTSVETGRNLLQIAVMEGWFTLTKCLVEDHGFRVEEVNRKEKNWNAFFYCVYHREHLKHRVEIFKYIMEKHDMDCFEQLDSEGWSVFLYATLMNDEIANEIFIREYHRQSNIQGFIKRLAIAKLNIVGMLGYFERNDLINKTLVGMICGDSLSYQDNETGRNLLQIAVIEGWLTLVKCLVENFNFNMRQSNKKENNWNVFFYCLCNSENVSKKRKIFTYLMEKDPFDCFGQLDSEGRSVFDYATSNNEEIAIEIFKQECKLQEHLPIDERIAVLMERLENGNLNSCGKILKFEQNNLIDEESVKIICGYLKSIEELYYKDEYWGGNLLHFACREGLLTLTKCLIEHYGFDAKEINEKEYNWNAFFYCVKDSENAYHKLEIFAYLMEKDPFDCFGQVDRCGKSVFYYATSNNEEIGIEIFKRECKLQEHLPIEERIPVLMERLQKSSLNSYGKIDYFEQNGLINEESINIVCDYLKSTGELNYKDEKTGRNLLHIACMEGWLTLTKCLIEHYGFDAKEINEKDDNWNAFFYCVGGSGNASTKLEIFTYLWRMTLSPASVNWIPKFIMCFIMRCIIMFLLLNILYEMICK